MHYIKDAGVFLFISLGSVGWALLFFKLLNGILIKRNHDPLAFDSWIERSFFLLSYGYGLMSLIIFFIGIAKLYYLVSVLFVLSIGCVVGLIELMGMIKKVKIPRRLPQLDRLPFLMGLIWTAFIISCLTFILFVHALLPPAEWDEIAYHLALPKIYILQHQIVYVPYILQANWPMAVQMLYVASLLLKSAISTHLLILFMTFLTLVGILIFSSKFLDFKAGLIACGLFISMPLVLRLGGTGMVDLALSFYFAAVLISLCSYIKTKQIHWLITCGIMCGFIASTKQTGIIIALIASLILLLGDRPEKRNFIQWLRPAITNSALAFAISAPWFIKSFVFTGDPLFPFLYKFLGGKNWDLNGSLYFQSVWGVIFEDLPRNFGGLLTSFKYVFLSPQRLGGYGGGFGQTQLILMMLGLLIFCLPKQKRSFALISLIFSSSCFYLFWFFFASLEIRYLTPIFVTAALLGGFGLSQILNYMPRNNFLAPLQIVAVMALTYILIANSPLIDLNFIRGRLDVVSNKISVKQYLDSRIDAIPAFRTINQRLPLDAVVLLLPYENRGYYIDKQYIWGHPANQRLIRFETFTNVSQLKDYLSSLGVNYILDNPTWLFEGYPRWKQDRQLMIELEKNCAIEISKEKSATLFKLETCHP